MRAKNRKTIMGILESVLLVGLVLAALLLIRGRGGEPSAVTAPDETAMPAPAAMPPIPEKKALTLAISEIMSANKCGLTDEDGEFSDWVELVNTGSDTVELTGCVLADKESGGWVFPSGKLEPGEYLVVFCSGKNKADGEFHTDFSLKSSGETLYIRDSSGETVFSCTYPACADNEAVQVAEGLTLTDLATPGHANGDYEGYIAAADSHGALVLYELASYNSNYAGQKGEFYDWIELKNVSAEPVELSDYYLGDDLDTIRDYTLPRKTLTPGECFIVFCSGDSSLTTAQYEHAPFALGSDGEAVYLYHKSGELSDRVYLRDVPLGGSVGRSDRGSGFYYFLTATPGGENGGGGRGYTAMPAASAAQGVYSGSVTVELTGPGDIYYTLDGSAPTASSTAYFGPITVDKTTVIRAVCMEGDKLPSHVATFSYILDSSELPVVSLSMDPTEFKAMWGNPAVEREVVGHVSFFDGEESFDIDCGTKLHGATSKFNADKKSMKLCFRTRYEGALTHDIFGNGVTEFASILLRSAQEDYYSTQMHDTVMHRLAIETFPELPSQDYRYCVLYLNGAYYGIYCLREAYSDTHYANHYGYDVDSVTSWKIAWNDATAAQETYQKEVYPFIVGSDMSVPANYERAAQLVNIDSFVGYTILQAYCGNFDCTPGNTRFCCSVTDGQYRVALVDLDLGWFEPGYCFDISFDSYELMSDIPKALLKNEEFRQYFLSELSRALADGLSDEHVTAVIDELADEIRSEIPRDRERWGGTVDGWERMVQTMRDFAAGRAKTMARNICGYVRMTDEEWSRYFGFLN